MVWKLPLYILWAASFFALTLADHRVRQTVLFPLNSCILTIQSTAGNVANARAVIQYGIMNRFAISAPSVNALTIVDGGSSDVFEDFGNGNYHVGFGVKSTEYGMFQLQQIVTEQWPSSLLFERDVGTLGNFRVLSVDC